MGTTSLGRYWVRRLLILALAKLFTKSLGQIQLAQAAPAHFGSLLHIQDEPESKPAGDPSLWLYLGVAAALVLLGGAFAGLTIALMGQDEIYLQVIKTSGEGAERKHATKVLKLLGRGKHWVLVTLLLSNVITNETLPIVLDRSLGGGWPAVLGSTVLIVIFGEIAPQSVCVRYGLPIGAWMSPFVLVLMYLMAPVAWPTAKLLDYLLGEDHGTVYKKAGLKTLVSLHRSLGEAGQQLNADEVTIISSVLDLKEKPVGTIMTPMDDVFTLSLDDVLNEDTMDIILSQGFSRVPIHHPDDEQNFVGMLLVKMLITYDPEDAKAVRDFALATLPETNPDTSCLDIVNFFQEGKSHMILVSDAPGTDHGALGVITLEDVIEELIGEEIVDESDVFVDIHKAVRRLHHPRMRMPPKPRVVTQPKDNVGEAQEGTLVDIAEDETLSPDHLQKITTADVPAKVKTKSADVSSSPPGRTFLVRRRSSAGGSLQESSPVRKRVSSNEMRDHFKHLGPSNLASRPKATRYLSVKIKPGSGTETQTQDVNNTRPRRVSGSGSDYGGGIGEGLLPSGGRPAKDGVQALHTGYGTIERKDSPVDHQPEDTIDKAIQTTIASSVHDQPDDRTEDGRARSSHRVRSGSHSTVNSLPRARSNDSRSYQPRGPARSGSITENVVDANGIRKVVLELTSSSSSNDEGGENGVVVSTTEGNKGKENDPQPSNSTFVTGLRGGGAQDSNASGSQDKPKKKKRRRRKGHGHGGGGEREPLLGTK